MGRVEYREESEQVVYAVYWYITDSNAVLCVVTSVDVDSGVIFAVGLYSRKVSDEVDRVGVAENLRQRLNHVNVNFHDVSFNGLYCRRVFLTGEGGAVQVKIQ